MVVFPEEKLTTPQQLASLLTAYFDLTVTPHRVERALDRLVSQNLVKRLPESGRYVPLTAVRDRIRERIAAAHSLQDRVKSRWITQCKTKYGPEFDGESAWNCLQKYLTALFRRHGLQTVSLLDVHRGPAKDAQPILKASLDDLLDQLECGETERKTFENAIRLFLSEVGGDSDRRTFVVQLADGAFSFYSLSAPPEVSARLQSKLEELTLFLDTNFLFGILGLHVNPFDSVSEELIAVVSREKLPFKLRYHEATLDEMHRTIVGITSTLKGRYWPQAVSRAAIRSPYISGIEKRFHEMNANQTVDPAVFFEPYDHPDVLLKDKGIQIYRSSSRRLEERADLIGQYKEFLERRHREKPYEAIDHDMTVLDCVRHLRSTAASSLDAKGLIVTCDTLLTRFDWQELRTNDELACTVLPNHFLQLLRPFITASAEFDKSFAESFAIAEFRTISKSNEATLKLLTMLATYEDIREETVQSLLANELLIDKLKGSKNDAEFKQLVDAAIAAENAQLLEELIAAQDQAAREKTESESVRADLETQRDGLLENNTDLRNKLGTLEDELAKTNTQSNTEIAVLKTNVTTKDAEMSQLERQLSQATGTLSIGAAAICAVVLALIGEFAIRRLNLGMALFSIRTAIL